ncbi:hypothetical protein HDU92_008284 [Lobulomyces angularis]|nr:hypothetical protein HDU92_008284 [Lobulomyces angularis]
MNCYFAEELANHQNENEAQFKTELTTSEKNESSEPMLEEVEEDKIKHLDFVVEQLLIILNFMLICAPYSDNSFIIERNKRYGKKPNKELEWKEIDWINNPDSDAEKFLQLNCYILDNTLPSGRAAAFQQYKKQNFKPIPIKQLQQHQFKKKEMLSLIVNYTIDCRISQYLEDGNHRTSILLLYELCSVLKLKCFANPIKLYILFSNCAQVSWDLKIAEIIKYCVNHSNFDNQLDFSQERKNNALKVKYLWYWNSFFEVISINQSIWYRSNDFEQREKIKNKLHCAKRNNSSVYKFSKIINKERM